MQATLVMFKANGERREFNLTRSVTVIGRKNTCDLRIPLAAVSREHCQIERRKDGLYLRDLGSANGTFYNDIRIQECKLKAGDTIEVGPVHFTVVLDGKPAEIKNPTPSNLPGETGGIEQVTQKPAEQTPPRTAPRPDTPVAAVSSDAMAGLLDDDDSFGGAVEVPAIETMPKVNPEQAMKKANASAASDTDDDDPFAALESLAASDDDDAPIDLFFEDEDEKS